MFWRHASGTKLITILKKREHYYKVFANFDPVAIAKFDEQKVAELMQDAGIIRNRLKIQAIITNAKAYLKSLRTNLSVIICGRCPPMRY